MSRKSFAPTPLIDVLRWDEVGAGVLAHRNPMADRPIRHGAALTVRDTQQALFVNEGRVADLFGPGLYQLGARTLPILAHLQSWDARFDAPFKPDVFFFSTREQAGLVWEMPLLITLHDKEGHPQQIGANGVYAFRIAHPGAFWTRLSGTVADYTAADAEGPLHAAILAAIGAAIGGSEEAFLDMATDQDGFSAKMKEAIEPAFAAYGLVLTRLALQNIILPDALPDPPSAPPVMGEIRGEIRRYIPAEAEPDAIAPAPPSDPVAMIERLGGLLQKGILTQAEFDAKKIELLQQIR